MILVIVGKSGSGKSYLQSELMSTGEFSRTVSHTTRLPRACETDGVDYHFVTKEMFEEMLEKDEFVNYDLGSMCGGEIFYGTHETELKNSEKPTIMVLSPIGAMEIYEKYGYEEVKVIAVKSDETLRILKMLERPNMSKQDIIDRLKVECAFDLDLYYMYQKGMLTIIDNKFDEDFKKDVKTYINTII